MNALTVEPELCYRAVASRDRRFEGRFVVAVTSTRVYCRPGCPAPIPRRENTRFYTCPAAAEEAGFRPCMRCRPETAPGSPAWMGTSATVSRGLRLIFEGALDDGSIESLAERLGVGSRHLRRLFVQHVGTTPGAIAGTRRVHFARKLIDETDLAMTDVALCAGFASVRRFNAAIRDVFRKPPRELRRLRSVDPAASAARGIELRLPVRQPYDHRALLAFLRGRAIAGVEHVTEATYRRAIVIDGVAGSIDARFEPPDGPWVLRIEPAHARYAMRIVERVAVVFDLRAEPRPIAEHLAKDPVLARALRAHPGVRVAGAFDPFELAVRAVLGQQVSVAAASTLAARLVARFGEPLERPVYPEVTRVFPSPATLAHADLESIGLPRARAHAVRELACAVHEARVSLDASRGLDDAMARLCQLPGIGPWTAAYIAMRALGEPDAFPSGDLGLRRAYGVSSPRELNAAAEAWRPWRAYAAMLLWSTLASPAPAHDAHSKGRP